MTIIKKAVLAVALGAATLTAASPAMADGYRGYRRGGDTTGAAIAGGIVGLALGAAIASGSRDRYYDDGYYYARPYPRQRSYYVYREYPRYVPVYPHREYRGYDRYDRRGYRHGW
ncbi:hypothetical protein H7F51_11580 [Novosphingobium flavum]|uniref:17 kDa surface antigen n=1 Tax=Novosphingobium flavum TaxID=1778672 RepID=A0A7X1FSI5_9SPHN|nr:hypothetical protein [Novosphingobium flavum]MBC2666158.1 hypothetical protein [Novosphingobium flavum]